MPNDPGMTGAASCPATASPGALPPYGLPPMTCHPLVLSSLDDAATGSEPARTVAGWVRDVLMRPHPDLGRTGHVCPFTAKSARLALLRIGVSHLGGDEPAAIRRTMEEAIRAFAALPCDARTAVFRTVVVAFPNCAGPEGIATLHRVQNALRHHSVIGGKMVGLFEPDSKAEGLINRAFRPLRAPLPVLAIRMLVEQDAPFVVRNPPLLPRYLLSFPMAGSRRLLAIAMGSVRRSRVAARLRLLRTGP